MFELAFADKMLWSAEKPGYESYKSPLRTRDIRSTQLSNWREHCLECAPPECYHTCKLYAQRMDGRCARFNYGIYPNHSFHGLFGFGADIRFRPWAKLTTTLYPCAVSPNAHRTLARLDFLSGLILRLLLRLLKPLSPEKLPGVMPPNPERTVSKAYVWLRERVLSLISLLGRSSEFDCFVLEFYSFERKMCRLQLEYTDSVIRCRSSFEAKPGHNYYEIPIEKFRALSNPASGSIAIYPENDRTARMCFLWLDFIKKEPRRKVEDKAVWDARRPAEKVKCVAWDLDNTLWEGILSDIGPENVKVKQDAVAAIKQLDERGIIQTVLSKNTYDEAWAALGRNGLQEYFVYPAINWAPKSSNLSQVAERIGIGTDTFAFIDDSEFERAEVFAAHPEVRVYREDEVRHIVGYPEFDVPVTEASKIRRLSYLTEMEREKVSEQYTGDYEAFLRHCSMEMRVFIPQGVEDVKRCYELIQRSNQLNLSSRRYTRFEFDDLLSAEGILSIALHCRDRFGDYGIVGFASVDENQKFPRLIDFVISCRVAQKRVEHAFFGWLATREKGRGQSAVDATLVKTKRNGPLAAVFENLPFEKTTENEETVTFRLALDRAAGISCVVKTVADLADLPR